jgi:hypothetical protein
MKEKGIKSVLDDSDEDVFRRTVHNSYLIKKERLTLKAIHTKMQEVVYSK